MKIILIIATVICLVLPVIILDIFIRIAKNNQEKTPMKIKIIEP